MTAEAVPGSVSTPGNLRIAFVPSGNALSVAILGGGTTKDLTYSFTPSGFNRSIAQADIADPRLALIQALSRPGVVTEGLEVQYVYGSGADVAAVALAEGATGFIVARYAVPNATAWTVGQKVDQLAIQCGHPRKDPPADNGVWTITQKIYITDVVKTDALLVA